MVSLPEHYRWSSVHANLGMIEDPLVTPHPAFLAQDIDPEIRTRAYRTWLRKGVGDDELESIRAHLQQERALGDVKFQAMVEKTLGRPVQLRNRGRPRSRASQPDGA
jgi:putative transposase